MKNIRLSFRADSGGPLRFENYLRFGDSMRFEVYPKFVNYLQFGIKVWGFTEVWELLVPEVLEIKVRVLSRFGDYPRGN